MHCRRQNSGLKNAAAGTRLLRVTFSDVRHPSAGLPVTSFSSLVCRSEILANRPQRSHLDRIHQARTQSSGQLPRTDQGADSAVVVGASPLHEVDFRRYNIAAVPKAFPDRLCLNSLCGILFFTKLPGFSGLAAAVRSAGWEHFPAQFPNTREFLAQASLYQTASTASIISDESVHQGHPC